MVVEWIQKEKYGLLDMNMLAKTRPYKTVVSRCIYSRLLADDDQKSAQKVDVGKGATEAIKYMWDNYVE